MASSSSSSSAAVAAEELAAFYAQDHHNDKPPNVLVERRVTWADPSSKLMYYFHIKVIKHFERDEGDFNLEVDLKCKPDHKLNPLTGIEHVDGMIYSFVPYWNATDNNTDKDNEGVVGYLRGRLLSRGTERLSNLLLRRKCPPLRDTLSLERATQVHENGGGGGGGYLSIDELEIHCSDLLQPNYLDLHMVHHLLVFLQSEHLNTEISVQISHPYGLGDCGWMVCVIPTTTRRRRQKYTSHSSSILRKWTQDDEEDVEQTKRDKRSRIRHFSHMGFLEAVHEQPKRNDNDTEEEDNEGGESFMYLTMDMYKQNIPPFNGPGDLRQVYEVTEMPCWWWGSEKDVTATTTTTKGEPYE